MIHPIFTRHILKKVKFSVQGTIFGMDKKPFGAPISSGRIQPHWMLTVLILSGALGLRSSFLEAAPLKIVATFPELADIARQIGGDSITVTGIARGTEDPHQIVMKPSFVVKLNQADAVVYNGLTLEHSFLPGLLDAASNPRMKPDTFQTCLGPGCIDCSQGVFILEKPSDLSRSQGELHPAGNPHYGMNPENGLLIARNIKDGLSRLDPAHSSDYEKNYAAFSVRLKSKIVEWKRLTAPLKGLKAVSYHKDIEYLAQFTGLRFVDTIELKPGVPTTPTHSVQLVELMKDQGIRLIVREQHFESKTPQWLADNTGARVAVIGVMAGAFSDSSGYIAFQEHNMRALLEAVGSSHP